MFFSPRTTHRFHVLVIAVTLVSLGVSAHAEDEEPSFAPGLELCYSTAVPGEASVIPDCRVARLVATHVGEAHTPGLFRKMRPFLYRWTGFLEIDLGDEFEFSVEGRGKFQLSLGGKTVLEVKGDDLSKAAPVKIELEGGHVPLVATYESPTKGDGFVRLYWSSFDWKREPVPPTVFFHDPTSETLRTGTSLRRVRELIVTRRCRACHAPTRYSLLSEVPELAMDAPTLKGIGGRYAVPWLARWISDPRSVRKSATMPGLFHEGGGESHAGIDDRAWHIAAYLDGLKSHSTKDAAIAPAALAQSKKLGGALFADLGCIGCHSLSSLPNKKSKADDDDRISLDHAAEKFHASSLVEFLLDPDARYKWIRMPDFRLSTEEAIALSSFVLSSARPPKPVKPPADLDPAKGEKLVRELGCGRCHYTGAEKPPPPAKPLRSIPGDRRDRGCVATEASKRGNAPYFRLDDEDRRALLHPIAYSPRLIVRDNSVEFADRQMRALRCNACHSRDNNAAIWSNHEDEVEHLIPDDGRKKKDPLGIPGLEFSVVQNRPPLTWAGEKLRPEWTRKFLSGELGYHVRPWLKSRMPKFPIRAAGIAAGLAMQHGYSPRNPALAKSDAKKAAIGKKLVLSDGGFACVSCHAAGKFGGDSVFEVPGVNFQYTTERLRREHFHRWMLNPGRVVRDSRMPQFADLDGKSPFTKYYDGDARQQFEAIWQWLLEGRAISPPE
jgi:mono/diheme cytochrome c family protein